MVRRTIRVKKTLNFKTENKLVKKLMIVKTKSESQCKQTMKLKLKKTEK